MALTKKNIIVGAARVYLGPATSATANLTASKPAFVNGTKYTTTMAGADGSTPGGLATAVTSWNEVGYTQDGLEVATDPSFGEIEVDQLLDSAKIFKDGMSMNISTTLAEATLENIIIAWGQASSTISSVGTGEREWSFEGGA